MLFILPENAQIIFTLAVGVVFVILPIVNHVGIFAAIRRQNNQVHDALSGQNLAVLFRREKKAAIDMFIVVTALMLCVAPILVVNAFQRSLRETFEVMFAWSTSLLLINSSINPVIYLVRNDEIRNVVRAMMCF